jgi:hypothetical protein
MDQTALHCADLSVRHRLRAELPGEFSIRGQNMGGKTRGEFLCDYARAACNYRY